MPDGSRGLEQRGVFCRIEYKGFEEKGDLISITGIATTPRSDRVGDVVEPKGAQFKLPIPFLWQHRSGEPIGNVVDAKVTKDGIQFRAEIPNPKRFEMGGTLRTRLVEALESMHASLVGWTSIGFAPKEMEPIDPKEPWGAQRFMAWEWLELSAVTIPANADAAIQSIKSLHAAATGKSVLRLSSPIPGASGSIETKGNDMKTISEKLKAWQQKRDEYATVRTDLMARAEKDGERVLTPEEQSEYDAAGEKVKQCEQQIVNYRELETEMKSTATAIDDESEQPGKGDKVDKSRDIPHILNLKAPKEEPGLNFARYVKAHLLARREHQDPAKVIARMYPHQKSLQNVVKHEVETGQYFAKANVTALNTQDAVGGGALVQYQDLLTEFLEWLRPQTIIGKFGMNGIPGLTRVDFLSRVRVQTSGGTGFWVGEGKPKPLTNFNFTNITMAITKVANIAVLTEEEVRFSTPAADMRVRNALAGALIERMDRDFIDPDAAGTANVQPASITYGAPTSAVSGTINSAAITDGVTAVNSMLQYFPEATLSGLVWIMSGRTGYALGQAYNSLGQRQFPDMGISGGTWGGIPVITSEYLAYGGGLSPASNNIAILVHAPSIFLADDGGVRIDSSTEASLQMLDNPTNDVMTPTPTTMVSMFQTDSIALRAERMVNWKRARDGSVYVLTNVAYSGLAA